MKKSKIPDNVVFNEKTQQFDAALRPYGTNLVAPMINPSDTVAWKNRCINKLNHKIKSELNELKDQYEALMKEFEFNQLIYDAKFSFEPIIGKCYHLYQRNNGETFLSIIAPHECDFDSLGSFYLNTDHIWEKVVEK